MVFQPASPVFVNPLAAVDRMFQVPVATLTAMDDRPAVLVA